MNTQSVNYELSDAKRQERLQTFTRINDPEDLRAELGMARLLAQEATDAGQTTLAARLWRRLPNARRGKLLHNGRRASCLSGSWCSRWPRQYAIFSRRRSTGTA